MSKKRTLAQALLAIAVTMFAVAGLASATTIGTNIATGGTLTVTGASTLTGAVAAGAALTVDTSTLVVDAVNNRVGIGTTTPGYRLTVAGDIMASGRLYDNSYSAGANGYVLVSTGSGIDWVATSSLGLGGASEGTVSAGMAGQVLYYPASGTAVSGTSSLTITSNGYIGIGTSGPISRLVVNGSQVLTGGLAIGMNSAPAGRLMVRGSGNNENIIQALRSADQALLASFYQNTNGKGAIAVQDGSNINAYISSDPIDDSFINSGNFGVGTSTPQNRFHVEGSSRFDGIMYLDDGETITNANDTISFSQTAINIVPITTSGSQNYTSSLAVGGYATGTLYMVTFTNRNTGGAFLNINGNGSKPIHDTGGLQLSMGEIGTSTTHLLMYDPTYASWTGRFIDLSK